MAAPTICDSSFRDSCTLCGLHQCAYIHTCKMLIKINKVFLKEYTRMIIQAWGCSLVGSLCLACMITKAWPSVLQTLVMVGKHLGGPSRRVRRSRSPWNVQWVWALWNLVWKIKVFKTEERVPVRWWSGVRHFVWCHRAHMVEEEEVLWLPHAVWHVHTHTYTVHK